MFDLNTPGWSREHDLELAKTFLRDVACGTECDYYRFGKALVRTARFLCDELEITAPDVSGDTHGKTEISVGPRGEVLASAGSVLGEARLAAKDEGNATLKIDVSGEGPVPAEIMDFIRRLGGAARGSDVGVGALRPVDVRRS